jgi:hypothetical protein
MDDEIIGGWRIMHHEELRNFYFSQNIITDQEKQDEMGRACRTHG